MKCFRTSWHKSMICRTGFQIHDQLGGLDPDCGHGGAKSVKSIGPTLERLKPNVKNRKKTPGERVRVRQQEATTAKIDSLMHSCDTVGQ